MIKVKGLFQTNPDNGTILSMPVKAFYGTDPTFWVVWFYHTALLVTKGLLDILMPEFNNVTESDYAESETTKKKQEIGRNRMVMGYLGTTPTSLKCMIKNKKSKLKRWSSGIAHEVAYTLKKRYTLNNMLSIES